RTQNNRDAMIPRSPQWQSISRRIKNLTDSLDEAERQAILGEVDRGYLSDASLELLNNAFDVSGANVYRIIGNRKTPQETLRAEKWKEEIGRVEGFAIGEREQAILRDTKAIVEMGFVPFPGQQTFLESLKNRQHLLLTASEDPAKVPDWLKPFFRRHDLVG